MALKLIMDLATAPIDGRLPGLTVHPFGGDTIHGPGSRAGLVAPQRGIGPIMLSSSPEKISHHQKPGIKYLAKASCLLSIDAILQS